MLHHTTYISVTRHFSSDRYL